MGRTKMTQSEIVTKDQGRVGVRGWQERKGWKKT